MSRLFDLLSLPLVFEGILLLILLVIGIIIIVAVVKVLLFFLPAAIIAIVVWFLTKSFFWAGVSFVFVAIISIVKRR